MSTSKLTINTTLPLPNSKVEIPQLGFGVYLSPPNVCTKSCLTALEAGYRHIDTAQYYDNESEVGFAIQQSGIPREEIFVTTKILFAKGSVEESHRACLESVGKIDAGEGVRQGYVDLFLIHSPNAGKEARKEMWLALEKLLEEGRTRAIGVSNFGVAAIEELRSYGRVWPPLVNQIEVSLCFGFCFHGRAGSSICRWLREAGIRKLGSLISSSSEGSELMGVFGVARLVWTDVDTDFCIL
jgi:diketogulonate reductase-like aldo/keto reductase